MTPSALSLALSAKSDIYLCIFLPLILQYHNRRLAAHDTDSYSGFFLWSHNMASALDLPCHQGTNVSHRKRIQTITKDERTFHCRLSLIHCRKTVVTLVCQRLRELSRFPQSSLRHRRNRKFSSRFGEYSSVWSANWIRLASALHTRSNELAFGSFLFSRRRLYLCVLSFFKAFLIVLVNVFILFEFYAELQLSRIKQASVALEKKWIYLQLINLVSILIFPAVYIHYRRPNPVGAFVAVSCYVVVGLKLFSYLHMNYQYRQALQEKKHGRYLNLEGTLSWLLLPRIF